MIEKEKVLEQLKTVIDPELNINIVELGLIYDVNIDQKLKTVNIKMTLTTPGCPLASVFDEWVRDAVLKVNGVKNVKIELVWDPPWNPDMLSDEAKEKLGILR